MKLQSNINNFPKRSLGQNFIINDNYVKKISELIETNSNTIFLEIGPGRGALTRHLIKRKHKKMYLIEKDNALASNLIEEFKSNIKVEILNKDALKIDYREFKNEGNVIIVGNLPFNISTQLLFKWISGDNWPPFYSKMYLMFQKEVGERIISSSNNKNFSRISVASQARCNVRKIMKAPASIFFPKPKVDAMIIEFTPSKKYIDVNFPKLQEILEKTFRYKRKKIKNSLFEYIDNLNKLNIDTNLRPENLTVNDYCNIARLIS